MTSNENIVKEIIEFLNEKKIRCTYEALADCLDGVEAWNVAGKYLGEKRPEVSWVVNKGKNLPTGFSENQMHPDLQKNSHVIRDAKELEAYVREFQSSKEKEEHHTAKYKSKWSDYIIAYSITGIFFGIPIGIAVLFHYSEEAGSIAIAVVVLAISVALIGIKGTITWMLTLFGLFRWLNRRD